MVPAGRVADQAAVRVVLVREAVQERAAIQPVEVVNSVWTEHAKFCLVPSLLVRTDNNPPEQMTAGASSVVKINVRDCLAELAKLKMRIPVHVMLTRLVRVRNAAERPSII